MEFIKETCIVLAACALTVLFMVVTIGGIVLLVNAVGGGV